MTPRRITLVVLIAFVSFLSGGWLLQRPQDQGGADNVYQRARLFDDILSHVAEFYVDTLTEAHLYDMAIDGLIDQINDPYTNYLKRDAVEDLTVTTTGNYGGLGVQIDTRDSYITVVAPLPETPGEQAGILAGDLIATVDGNSTKGWTTDHAVRVMRGPVGTDVHLGIVRAGVKDTLRITVKRAAIHVNAVEGPMTLGDGVGYVKLDQVSSGATAELAHAIDSLQRVGARSLILDLRGNPGGILQEAVQLADLFVDAGKVVVETRGRAPGESEVFRSERPDRWPGMPVVVLVNDFTASAAEILSGALQDHDRGLILGTPTFGKGVAYQAFQLSPTEAVTVTTSRWYTPSGRTIDRGRLRHAPEQHVPVDSSKLVAQDSSVFRTDLGRHLHGGGGIQPDVVLRPDTLSTAEQVMVKALGSKIPEFRSAVGSYALALKGQGRITSPDFAVTRDMVQGLLKEIRSRGVTMPDSIWYGAEEIVSQQLSFDVARDIFGRTAELKRRNQVDNQVQRAMQLLRGSRTMADLFRVAGPGD